MTYDNSIHLRMTPNVPGTHAGQSPDKLKEVCQEFEALFLKNMLDSMKKTINKTGLMGESMAEDIFEDMLYTEYAKTMSKTGSFGITDMLYNQLKSTSEVGD